MFWKHQLHRGAPDATSRLVPPTLATSRDKRGDANKALKGGEGASDDEEPGTGGAVPTPRDTGEV